ncbi:hypothetical protein PV325_003500 [Microctonus aethiopoides]|nr:hypothetical protein PV325_003500 [Microctonus aethiopoides]
MPSVTANTGHLDGSCNHDDDCGLLLACHKGICIGACEVVKCGPNTYCNLDNHHGAVCKCLLTHKGDPYTGCFEKSGFDLSKTPEYSNYACNHDDDCYSLHTCHQGRCISPCKVIKCGPNARCDYGLPHSAVCKCLLTHKGDPYTGCFEVL